MYTDNPVKEAEVYYIQRDKQQEEQAIEYAESITAQMHSLETFKSFLWDIDTDTPEVQAFHGCLDTDENTKVFAYDTLMNLFEDYVHSITEL